MQHNPNFFLKYLDIRVGPPKVDEGMVESPGACIARAIPYFSVAAHLGNGAGVRVDVRVVDCRSRNNLARDLFGWHARPTTLPVVLGIARYPPPCWHHRHVVLCATTGFGATFPFARCFLTACGCRVVLLGMVWPQ